MATDVIVRVGTGGDYANLSAARTALNSLNLVSLDQRIVVKLLEDQTLTNTASTFNNTNTDATRYIYVRPDDGLSWDDVAPGSVFYPPSAGLKIVATAGSSGALSVDRGWFFDLLRIEATPTVAGVSPVRFGNTSSPKYTGMARCWISGDHTLAALLDFRDPSTTAEPTQALLLDSVVIGTGTDAAVGVITGSGGALYRNTIVANGGAGRALRLQVPAAGRGFWVADNALAGSWETVHTSGASLSATASAGSRGNYLTGAYVQTGTGTTYTSASWATGATAASLFENIASNLRPSSTSALLGAASSRAENVADINGGNRGLDPDIGAVQRNAAVPLPSGTINTPTVDGQTATLSGTQTNAVSGVASIGSEAKAITIVGGNWTAPTWTGLPAGTLAVALTLTNSAGTSLNFTGPNIVIGSTGGDPEGPSATLAPGAVWVAHVEWLPGEASAPGAVNAPGAAWEAAASWLPGAAAGTAAGTAPGRTFTAAASWLPGAATGAVSAVAPGVLVIASLSWLPGAAAGGANASAPGVVWATNVAFVPGAATLDATVLGAAWGALVTFVPGMALSDFKLTASRTRVVVYAPDTTVRLPTMDVEEMDDVPFDFSPALLPSDAIRTVEIEVDLRRGDDEDPDGMRYAMPEVGTVDAETGEFEEDPAGAVVVQRFSAVGRGIRNTYSLRCRVTLASGRKLVAAGQIRVRKL